AMRKTLDDDGQIILLLNLRGFSPTLWCRACGTAAKCPHCDITLTWHKDRNVALCHSCDFHTDPITHCPTCGTGGVRYLGIGTQRLEQEVKQKFPGFRCLRMDSDAMRRPGAHDEALEAFRRGEVQILLGTQMIAKGLDFPNVTLVGVVNADTSLHQPDLRASERTFQLISQVAGRTGRSSRGGRVYVQSASPSEPAVLKAAEHDYLGFVEHEMQHRREMTAPPFTRLVRVILRGPIEAQVQEHAREMARIMRQAAKEMSEESPETPAIRILGPAPAPIAKLKKHYRYHFQLSCEQAAPIQRLWHTVSDQLPQSSDVEYAVDVDPINMK
ncbi:MAG: replication restart helicase PriA, partial [Planctomycetaceae bacterium]